MSLCINPRCPQPDHPDNAQSRDCQACGSDLLLQGRYRVMRLLSSQSGFGKVYEAYERDIPKILKVLKESHNLNSKVLELFQREAMVLAQLNHPGVPQVEPAGYFVYYPKGSSQPLHCIVMEKIDGPNLKQWMVQQGNHTISEQQALLWLTQITDVLHLVHQHNYFHRDIKPENVMLRSNGQLVLVDFGAAREMTETYMGHLGDSGITTISSAGYTPPEQEQGQAVPQSDFYALGRTIVYLLTAKTPSDPAIYDSRANAFNWRDHAPQVSTDLASLIDDLIAPRAVDRPQTTQAILQRLAAVRIAQPAQLISAEAGPLPALPAWPTTTLEPAHLTQAQSEQTQHQAGPASARPLWRWGLLGAALVGLLVGAPVLWWEWQRSQESTAIASAPSAQVVSLKQLAGHTGPVRALLINGNTVISGSGDKTIRIWDLQQSRTLQTLIGHRSMINTLALSTDQLTLFSAGSDQDILIWDLATGKVKQTIAAAHSSPINTLTLSPDGKLLASGSADGEVKVWDAKTGELAAQLNSQDSVINTLIFSRDGRYLFGGGQALQRWELDTQQEKLFFNDNNFINDLATSPDNQVLISVAADKTVRFWDLATGDPLGTGIGHASSVNDVVISADGLTFVTAGADGTLCIWDMNSRKLVERLEGFGSDIYRYGEAPAGQIVTAGGKDYTVKVFGLAKP